jgi:tetratricopeptide (TPR) repeat protein
MLTDTMFNVVNHLFMKIIKISPGLFILILLMFFSCNSKNKEKQTSDKVVPDSVTVTVFARQIQSSVNDCDPDFYNNAFDKAYIKNLISQNSIVYSSMDIDFGKKFFENNFKIGDFSVSVVEKGGDFRFVRYYKKEGQHHVVFRTYQDYGMTIDDFVVDTVKGQLKIKDGFIYNLSTSFSNNVCYNVLFEVMNKTNPESATKNILDANTLLKNGKSKEAKLLLLKNKELLKEYPYYRQLYIQSIYESDKPHFVANLEQLRTDGFDERSVMLHKLLFYSNSGMVAETEKTINQLIEETGDDPIYLIFFGKANFYAGNYSDALFCYNEAEKGMPLIWDLWYGKLECYAKSGDKPNFDKTLKLAESVYKMKTDEINQFVKTDFPEMIK